VDNVASSRNLEGQDSEPTNGVLPATRKAPGWIDEATDIHGEGSVDRIHDREFSQCLHHQVNHNTDDQKSDDDSSWATSGERSARANEQTGANSTTTVKYVSMSCKGIVASRRRVWGDKHSNHLHVTALQVFLELVLVGVDHGDIVTIDAELTSLGVICQAVMHRWR
jgi:hypothetical protein